MAAGCIEPQFFALMLSLLEIDPKDFGPQMSPKHWASQHKRLEELFSTKTRDAWADIFNGTDACVTPVLDYQEACSHPQNAARGGLKPKDGLIHPQKMPKFESVPF